MNFLKSDLSRNFAIGFAVGTLIVVFQLNPDIASQLVPDAIAATVR
ncbi:hypothetical protein [Pontixanthobacter gangjinensis]|nr:hypothetical protein [Pontixanthobacter gangjinensis]